jgi:hypothetical protein
MLGWVETRMGPGANERSNGLVAFGLFGICLIGGSRVGCGLIGLIGVARCAVSLAVAASFAITRTTALAVSRTAAAFAWRAVTAGRAFAAARTTAEFAIAGRRTIGAAAFESWPGRRTRRMRKPFLDELGHLVELVLAQRVVFVFIELREQLIGRRQWRTGPATFGTAGAIRTGAAESWAVRTGAATTFRTTWAALTAWAFRTTTAFGTASAFRATPTFARAALGTAALAHGLAHFLTLFVA